MHYLIRIIVEAKGKRSALAKAEYTAESLVESDDFDSYRLDGPWGKSQGHKLSSPEGRKLIESGMEATRRNFDEAMQHVRYMVEHYTDDQIYTDKFDRAEGEKLPEGVSFLSRWQFFRAYGSTHTCNVCGSDDIWGGPIENDHDLEAATEGKRNLWVVLVDFYN